MATFFFPAEEIEGGDGKEEGVGDVRDDGDESEEKGVVDEPSEDEEEEDCKEEGEELSKVGEGASLRFSLI